MKSRLLFFALAFFGSLLPISAHPHMWIEGNLLPVLGPGGLEAVEVEWRFDQFNSAALIRQYDADGNGVLDDGEQMAAKAGSFDRQLEQEYYLLVNVGDLLGSPMAVTAFQAAIDQGRLVYHFTVPLAVAIRYDDLSRTSLALFDQSYFIDFRSAFPDQVEVFWGEDSWVFNATTEERSTLGYGKITVTGLSVDGGTGGGRRRFSLGAWLKDTGFGLQERLAGYTREVTVEQNPKALWTALALSFVFGLIHVMGPGHGKVFTLAYFSSRQARLSEGMALSALINVLDSLSALLLVGVTYGILTVTIQASGAVAGKVTKVVAYGAVALLGFGHLVGHLRGHHRQIRDDRNKGKTDRQLKPWMLALSVGLVPCPVSSAILAYGVAEGALAFSLLLVLGVSLGGMAAMSFYSMAIIGGKAGLTRVLSRRGMERGLDFIEIGSMALLGIFGVILLVGVL